MKPHVSGITLGVKDVNRAKQFYFTDPDGNLWKVAAAGGEQPSAAEWSASPRLRASAVAERTARGSRSLVDLLCSKKYLTT